MTDIQIVLGDGYSPPRFGPMPLAVAAHAPVQTLLPHIISLAGLPTTDDNGQTLRYCLRPDETPRIIGAAQTCAETGVVKGMLVVLEPTLPLRVYLAALPPLADAPLHLGAVVERMAFVAELMPLFAAIVTALARDIAQGCPHPFLNDSAILVKTTADTAVILFDDSEPATLWRTFANRTTTSIYRMERTEVLEQTRRLAGLSPRQRRTGNSADSVTAMPDTVYAVGALLYAALLDEMPPFIQAETDIGDVYAQIMGRFPQIGAGLCRVLTTALHPQPAQRYATVTALWEAFAAQFAQWSEQWRLARAALSLAQTPNQGEQALATFQRIPPDFIAAWGLAAPYTQLQSSMFAVYAQQAYSEAVRLSASRKRDDLRDALELLQKLPRNYADAARYIAAIEAKLR